VRKQEKKEKEMRGERTARPKPEKADKCKSKSSVYVESRSSSSK